MTVRARIIAALVSDRGRRLCASCLGHAVGLSAQTVRNGVLSLPPTTFDRRIATCEVCAAQRLTFAHLPGRAAAS